MEEFRDRRISVIGAARSGLSAARVLTRLGARVLLSDSQAADRLGEARVVEIKATGAQFVLGADPDAALPPGTEIVVTSPGVPAKAPVLRSAVERGIPVWSEIELAYRLTDVPIIAITGTNGKTTTTLLIAAMLEAAGKDALVCGNVSADEIKRTLVDAAFETPASSILVAEVSSFQLEWVDRFAPKVAVLTNITPDHLNRHASFEEYARTKARLFAAQRPDDRAILNYDNPPAREIGRSGLRGRCCWFTRLSAPPDDGPAAWLREDTLMVRLEADRAPIELMAASELPPTLPGAHSIENALAAVMAALLFGASPETVRDAIRGFRGVPHRMEFVADVDGVHFINNSMCTNIAAAVNSLLAVDRPTVVIAGGADKELDFAPLVPALKERARALILIGQAANKMEAAFRAGGYNAILRADSLDTAVRQAKSQARPGDAVLLSPACASFDMFTDFESRGVAFRNAVNALKEIA